MIKEKLNFIFKMRGNHQGAGNKWIRKCALVKIKKAL